MFKPRIFNIQFLVNSQFKRLSDIWWAREPYVIYLITLGLTPSCTLNFPYPQPASQWGDQTADCLGLVTDISPVNQQHSTVFITGRERGGSVFTKPRHLRLKHQLPLSLCSSNHYPTWIKRFIWWFLIYKTLSLSILTPPHESRSERCFWDLLIRKFFLTPFKGDYTRFEVNIIFITL